MGRKLSEETIDKIQQLYEECHNYSKVAKDLGTSPNTVRKYVLLKGCEPPERKSKSKITDEMIDEINRRYAECKNVSQVARELGISITCASNHLSVENLILKEQEYMDRDALYFYIIRLFGIQSEEKPVSDWNVTQMNKFKEQGMPYRGQLLTLKYFYEVEHHTTEKSHGSIGIIPFVWGRANQYYARQAIKADQITEQIKKQLEKDIIEIPINPKNLYSNRRKKKKLINLDSLGD